MSLFDPPANQVQIPNMPMGHVSGIDSTQNNLLGGIGNLSNFNTYAQYLPQAQGIAQGMVNNPYAAGAQTGANQAGSMGMQAGANQFGAAGGLYGYGSNLFGAGNQAYQSGFDPQSTLYNQQFKQQQDQTRAGQAQRGILTSPYGAGLEAKSNNNFNTDWQNQQLQRQLQGLQGMQSAYGAGANLFGQGAQGQAQGAQTFGAGAMLPYQTALGIGQNQFGALQNLGGFGTSAAQIPQQQIGDWQNYLGYGNQVNQMNNNQANAQAQLGLQQNQLGFNQQMQMFSGLGGMLGNAVGFGAGGGLGSLVGMFGGGGMGGSGPGGSGSGGGAPYYG